MQDLDFRCDPYCQPNGNEILGIESISILTTGELIVIYQVRCRSCGFEGLSIPIMWWYQKAVNQNG